MKTLISILLFLNISVIICHAQCDNYCINFEDTFCNSTIIIDTTEFPTNLWQIGKPQKPVFDSVANLSNTIITDTINSYPINNHSIFIIQNTVTMGFIYGLNMLRGSYFVQSDSLNDYGTMDVSTDNGLTWIDIINDTVYNSFVWYSLKPVLTGNSSFNIQLGDTVLFRFSFISDSIPENLGGLMFDDICFDNFVEGISETHFKQIKSSIYPNPSSNIFTIEFENPKAETFELSIYDIHSKLTLKKDDITENKIVVDATAFKSGTYIYKITNLTANKRCWGKFITNN